MSNSKRAAEFISLPLKRPSDGERFPLKIIAIHENNDSYGVDDTRIVVLDGWDEQVSDASGSIESFGSFDADLLPGLYTARLERGGIIKEEVIRHTEYASSEVHIMIPRRNSAMPSFDTANTHEYYSGEASNYSRNNTKHASDIFGKLSDDSPRLFIFIRLADRTEHADRDLVEALFLYDIDGHCLTDFSDNVVERSNTGWASFSAPVNAGTYILRHAGLEPREMLISVYADWDTQLFIPYRDRPLLERVSLMLARKGAGFEPNDLLAQVIDNGLAGLQSGVDCLPRMARNILLNSKFDNPMQGLIGAHLLLMDERLNQIGTSEYQSCKSEFETVLGNLDFLLPGSADVQALRLALSLKLGDELSLQPLSLPPMLRRGMDAVLRASAVYSEIIPEGSFIEKIAPYLVIDSSWTVWSPPFLVAGISVDSPIVEVSKLAEQLIDKELVQISGQKTSKKNLTSIANKNLPVLLGKISNEALDGLSRGKRELNDFNFSIDHLRLPTRKGSRVVVPKLTKEAVKLNKVSAVRLVVKKAMLRGVDAALRTQGMHTSLVKPATEIIPVWVRRILEDAGKKSLEEGIDVDLAKLAQEFSLPLGAMKRWQRALITEKKDLHPNSLG